VLRYTPTLGLTLALAASAACKSKREAPPPPPPPVAAIDAGAPDADQAGAHGDKWKGGEPGDEFTDGGFQNFKEAWVYVDGKPAGVLREPAPRPGGPHHPRADRDLERAAGRAAGDRGPDRAGRADRAPPRPSTAGVVTADRYGGAATSSGTQRT
jgi:hypothetical protein